MPTSPVIDQLLKHRRALDALNALALLEEYKASRTLTELALEHCRREKLPERCGPPITLSDLFTRYQGSLAPEQVRYRAGHRSVAKFLCARLGGARPAASIGLEEVEAALGGYTSASTYNSAACRVRAVFRWALHEKLLGESPVAHLELKRLDWHEPAYFLPEKVERIFRAAEAWAAAPGATAADRRWGAAVLRLLALGFFAGVRTAEIARARVEDLDLSGATLRIPRPKGYTRGMRPRLIELESNCVAWLKRYAPAPSVPAAQQPAASLPPGAAAAAPPLVPDLWRFTAWKKRVLAPLGLSWGGGAPDRPTPADSAAASALASAAGNIMRHTYATMHVGAFRNAAATALNMGHAHSSNMLEKHYRGLVPKAVAIPYWKILPSR